jgi:agmatine/peptidylarginine deiminase
MLRYWWKRQGGFWRQGIALLCVVAAAFWSGAQWGSARAGRVRARRPAIQAHTPPADGPARPLASARTPRPCGVLQVPGEFQRQAALILVCNELLPSFPRLFRSVVAAAHGHVPIVCVVSSPQERQTALGLLAEAELPPQAVRFVTLPLDTMWVRDYGPIFVQDTDGTVFLADLDYTPSEEAGEVRWRDNNAPRLLGEVLALPVTAVPLRLSGGNLLSNGDGLCVTTSAILRDNADRGYDPRRIRSLLCDHLGFRQWVCLPELDGERTKHVDMFVTFLAPDLAVVGQMDASVDPTNAAILDAAAAELARQQTSRGAMRVFRIPMPPGENGTWRSYSNVIFANGVLLVPTFSGVEPSLEKQALDTYASLLPGWKVVGINCDELLPTEGLLHCLSQNVPEFVPMLGIERGEARDGEAVFVESCFPPRMCSGRPAGWASSRPAGVRRVRGQQRPHRPIRLLDEGANEMEAGGLPPPSLLPEGEGVDAVPAWPEGPARPAEPGGRTAVGGRSSSEKRTTADDPGRP